MNDMLLNGSTAMQEQQYSIMRQTKQRQNQVYTFDHDPTKPRNL